MSAPPVASGPGGPEGAPAGPPPNLTSNKRLQQTEAQVSEVVGIMRDNVDKVIARDEKLSELDDRADKLQAGAQLFETRAAQLKRKYWWKNCKMMIIMGVICAIMVVIIINKMEKNTVNPFSSLSSFTVPCQKWALPNSFQVSQLACSSGEDVISVDGSLNWFTAPYLRSFPTERGRLTEVKSAFDATLPGLRRAKG
ncbi:vesicle-associated membrane protein 1 isoform X1 [Microcaecilia unicolor]|uniref:Vesicle-associated membrane protein 1 isoform X1 n=1 Tax=Microcaecilia unicolor TaxID=1415580 RepID=A0A6P7X1W7_9AMPH|nr:vesicle-associated membrane protein 1 isoform X1 [Microcaecilia unicolor]